jgi:hypothetical protein
LERIDGKKAGKLGWSLKYWLIVCLSSYFSCFDFGCHVVLFDLQMTKKLQAIGLFQVANETSSAASSKF